MSWDNSYINKRRSMTPPHLTGVGGLGGNQDFQEATLLDSPNKAKAQAAKAVVEATPVSLPDHIFVPAGAQSIDLRRLATVTNGTNRDVILRWKSPPGVVTRFISYGVFNDGSLASQLRFDPEVDGNRVFPYHGDPLDNFRISLGLGPDLTNISLIGCQLALMPEQEIIWYVSNSSGVDVDMGVRMVGYLDTKQRIATPRFGG